MTDWSAYIPGARVVCVKSFEHERDALKQSTPARPQVGEVYTIRSACPRNALYGMGLYIKLNEIKNDENVKYACAICGRGEGEFLVTYFRPVKTIDQKQTKTAHAPKDLFLKTNEKLPREQWRIPAKECLK